MALSTKTAPNDTLPREMPIARKENFHRSAIQDIVGVLQTMDFGAQGSYTKRSIFGPLEQDERCDEADGKSREQRNNRRRDQTRAKRYAKSVERIHATSVTTCESTAPKLYACLHGRGQNTRRRRRRRPRPSTWHKFVLHAVNRRGARSFRLPS